MNSKTSIEQINNLPFGRAYKLTNDITGQVEYVPSVTTVLKLNQDSYITELKEELGEEKFLALQVRGANRGSVMHRWQEEFFNFYEKNPDPVSALLYTQDFMAKTDEFKGMDDLSRAQRIGRELFYNFYNAQFYKQVKKVLYNEIFLHTFFRGGWAGACDFVFTDQDDKLVILDYKSSTIPKDLDHIDNYKMQISCYMFKFAEMSGLKPDRGIIAISNELNSQLQYVTVTYDEMKVHLRKFLKLLEEFKAQPEWIEFQESVKVTPIG